MFSENLRIALRAVFSNKMRSILTVLGVMIGVAAVIAVVSLVQGLQKKISADLESVGATFIRVIPDLGVQSNPFLQKMPELTYDDALAVKKGATAIRNFTPLFLSQAQLKRGDARHSTTMIGVNQTYQDVVNHWVDHGRFFTTLDEEAKKRVAVLGVESARKLGLNDPLGQVIQIDDTAFTVIGVMEKRGSSITGDSDDLVLIPFATAQILYGADRMKHLPLALQVRNRDDVDLEAVVLSGFGGLVGIVGGTGLANLIRLLLGKWVTLPPVHTPLWAILIAFGFCAFLGILFGIYPAAKASKLDPIEALRYE